eukprot:3940998-Rhodomonas_salina.4
MHSDGGVQTRQFPSSYSMPPAVAGYDTEGALEGLGARRRTPACKVSPSTVPALPEAPPTAHAEEEGRGGRGMRRRGGRLDTLRRRREGGLDRGKEAGRRGG